MDMIKRPRRLRGGETIRKMVRETRMDKSSLIYPMFVQEGTGREDEIPSMPGQFRYTLDRLPYELERLAKAGVGSVMLFGIPDHKDEIASQAYAQDGIVQRALQVGKEKFPELYYITDVCLCEYTSHGHCGMLCGNEVENDSTLDLREYYPTAFRKTPSARKYHLRLRKYRRLLRRRTSGSFR